MSSPADFRTLKSEADYVKARSVSKSSTCPTKTSDLAPVATRYVFLALHTKLSYDDEST